MESKLANREREAFQHRLTKALASAGCKPTPSTFAREFNLRADGAKVTVHGARKWLKGESFPTQERVHVLANWLKVSAEWLRFGDGPNWGVGAANDSGGIPHDEVVLLGDFRRLDERSQAVVKDLIVSLLKNHSLRK
jgi:hypothetical protein